MRDARKSAEQLGGRANRRRSSPGQRGHPRSRQGPGRAASAGRGLGADWSMGDGVLPRVITFGKYRGRQWAEVLRSDPTYVYWIMENTRNPMTKATAEAVVDGRLGPLSRHQ